MTELQKRMIEDLQLKGMSERTQEMYVRPLRQLAEHYHKSPDQISEEELRRYFLFIKNVKHYSRSASTIALSGLKFFYEQTLKYPWPTLTFVRAPREKKLPTVLSLEEVRLLLNSPAPHEVMSFYCRVASLSFILLRDQLQRHVRWRITSPPLPFFVPGRRHN